MAAVAIPHPFASTDAIVNPSQRGIGESELRDYFLKMIPSLATDAGDRQLVAKLDSNAGRWKSDWTLSDMKNTTGQIAISNIQELINEAAQDTWYYLVCPRFETTDLQYEVINVFFRPTPAQQAAPRTVPRQLDIQRTGGQFGLSRYIHGFQLDTETLLAGVEKGVEWFTERVAMMSLGIQETDKMMIITGIMNMHRARRVRAEEFALMVRSVGGLSNSILRESDVTFSLVKQKDPIRYLRDVSNTDFQFLGVPTTGLVTILHSHAARVLVSNEFYRNRSQGDQQEFLDDSASATRALMTRENGAVYFVRNFRDRDGRAINPIGGVYNLALYYPLVDPHADCPDMPYKTEYRNAKITADNGNMQIIKFEDAALRTDRWDPITGDLRSLVDADEWAAANADLRQKLGRDAQGDALHTSIGKPHYDEEPYVGPAPYWGSVKQSTISTNTFLSCAKSVAADIDERNKIEAGLEEFMALVGEAGNQPIDQITGIIGAIRGTASDFRNAGMVGCKSSNPALKFHKTSPSTGFPETGYGVGTTSVSAMPAGFGSLAAMRYLVGVAADPLKKRIQKVIDAASLLTAALRNKFSSSVLLDPNYASTDLQYANIADMLFSTALMPRRAVVIVQDGAGGSVDALESAVKQLLADARNYVAGTGKEAFVSSLEGGRFGPSALAVASGSAAPVNPRELINLATMSIALRSFKKNGPGLFVADPEAALTVVASDLANRDPSFFVGDIVNALKAVPSPKTAFSRTSTELKTALEDAVKQLSALGSSGSETYSMTKLYLEPSQVVDLAVKSQSAAGFTIGREDRHDVPATDEELDQYAKSIRTAATALAAFGAPLGARWPLTSAGSVSAVHAVGQLRRFMHENGYPIPSRQAARRSPESLRPVQSYTNKLSERRNRIMQNLLTSGSSALASSSASASSALSSGAADPTGTARELFACVDHRLDLMFTDSFVANWDGINLKANSLLELIVARLYLTTPTNFRKSVALWATNNVRIPFTVAITRVIRVRTNPVIRMVPGANTCRLAVGFRRSMSGTNQNDGIFGMIHSYYAGFLPIAPNNVMIYNNVDVMGYEGGLERRWADFSRNVPGMVAIFMPGNDMPAVFSPFGPIEMAEQSPSAPEPMSTGTETIALFEQMRQGRMNAPWPTEERLGLSPVMGVPVESLTTRYYMRDTTLFQGSDCSFTKHVTSMGPLPTSWCTSDLQSILEGRSTTPSDPLRLGANNQLAVHSH